MTFPGDAENDRLLNVSADSWIDKLLLKAPVRTAELARPTRSSALHPVVGDLSLPVVGSGLASLRWGPAHHLDLYRRYGPVTWTKSRGNPVVIVAGPEATEVVGINRDRAFRQGWEWFIGNFFPRGLMLLDFDEHMFHRRLMQQAFTRDRLKYYFDDLTKVIDTKVTGWPNGPTTSLYALMKDLTLSCAADVFMGIDVDAAEREKLKGAFVACAQAGLSIFRCSVPGGNWRAGLKGRAILEEYFTSLIPSKRISGDNDFFSTLSQAHSEDGQWLSDADIVNHIIFLLEAAHETTTTAATVVAYYLGKHKNWQDRVRAESLAREGELPTISELEELDALGRVVKESLRLVPPLPAVVRKTNRDCEILGQYVPGDTTMLVSHWVNHLLPEYWRDPGRFDPDRFSAARQEDKSHRYAYVPFGGGAHKCIGMHFGIIEVKAIIDAMVRRYEWYFPPEYEIHWKFNAGVPYPRDGVPLTLRRRASFDF